MRGDRPELGEWGWSGDGLKLSTDAELYPAWLAADAVALPVGATVQWKYTAVDDQGTVRWESGDNRSLVAGPLPLVADTMVTASWR